MKCGALLLVFAMAVIPVHGEETYIYQYDTAGNCVGRVISSPTTLKAQGPKQQDVVVEVFPLETHSEFYICLDSEIGENNSFAMSSIDGTHTYTGNISEDITTIDVSTFKAGIYTLGVTYNNNLYSFKIIKK